jgi:hypothetical protein
LIYYLTVFFLFYANDFKGSLFNIIIKIYLYLKYIYCFFIIISKIFFFYNWFEIFFKNSNIIILFSLLLQFNYNIIKLINIIENFIEVYFKIYINIFKNVEIFRKVKFYKNMFEVNFLNINIFNNIYIYYQYNFFNIYILFLIKMILEMRLNYKYYLSYYYYIFKILIDRKKCKFEDSFTSMKYFILFYPFFFIERKFFQYNKNKTFYKWSFYNSFYKLRNFFYNLYIFFNDICVKIKYRFNLYLYLNYIWMIKLYKARNLYLYIYLFCCNVFEYILFRFRKFKIFKI